MATLKTTGKPTQRPSGTEPPVRISRFQFLAPIARPTLAPAAWVAFLGLVAVLLYGFVQERLFLQTLWHPEGWHRMTAFAGLYILGAAIAFYFKRELFLPGLVACALFYTLRTVGAGPVAAMAFVACAATAIGDMALRRFGLRRESLPRAEAAVLSFLTGMGFIVFVVSLTSHFGVNYAALYGVALAVPLWMNRGIFAAYLPWPRTTPQRPLGTWLYLAMAALGFVLFAHLLLAIKPEAGFDALVMHLVVPSHMAIHHVWPFDVHRFIWAVAPMGGDWAYTPAYLLGGEFGSRLMNWLFLCAIVTSLYCLLRRRLPRPLSVFCVALFASSPIVALVTGSLFIENVLGAFIIGAALAIDRLRRTRGPYVLFCACVLLGSAAAAKIGALPYVLPLAIFAFFPSLASQKLKKSGAALTWRHRFVFAALLIILGAWPYCYAWKATGNPFYPFMNSVFRSPQAPPVAYAPPSANVNPISHLPATWKSPYGILFRTHEYLESQDGAAGFQYLFLFPMCIPAIFWGRRSIGLRAAACAAILGCGLILRSQPSLRYIYPGLPLAAAAGFAALSPIRRISPALARALIALFAVLLPLNVYFFASAGWEHRTFLLNTLLDENQTDEYVESMIPGRRMVQYLNLRRPGQPAWFLGPPQIAGLIGIPYLSNWYQPWFAEEVDSAKTSDELLAIVKKHGLRNFVVPLKFPRIPNPQVIRDFLAECTVSEWTVGSVALLRLRDDLRGSVVFVAPDNKRSWSEWQSNGIVKPGESPGDMQVSVVNTMVRKVLVNQGQDYEYSMEASCPVPGTALRLQINWHDAAGRFIGTSLEPRQCDEGWRTYSMHPVLPPAAHSGVVIVGGHGDKPVIVRRVVLRF